MISKESIVDLLAITTIILQFSYKIDQSNDVEFINILKIAILQVVDKK